MISISSNTVEQIILDTVAKLGGMPASMVREDAPPYAGESSSDELTWRTEQSGQALRVRKALRHSKGSERKSICFKSSGELQTNRSLASGLPTSSLLITNTKGFCISVIRSLERLKGLIPSTLSWYQARRALSYSTSSKG